MDETIDGALIRLAREKAGLSQQDLASLVGVGRTQISRIETGERGASLKTLRGVARALGLDPSVLIGGSSSDEPSTPRDASAA